MASFIGGSPVDSYRIGAEPVDKIYLGTDQIYPDAVGPALKAGTVQNPTMMINLSWDRYHNMLGHNPFLDWMKTSTQWNGFDDLLANGKIDIGGRITAAQTAADPYFECFVLQGPQLPSEASGTFRLRWTGAGVLELPHVSNQTQIGPNEIEFEYTPEMTEWGPTFVIIRALTGPVSSINLVHVDDLAAFDSGEFFNTRWMDDIRNFRVIRFKDWGDVDNYEGPTNWADRPRKDWISYDRNGKIPVEVMIELANRVGADAWFSMPHTAPNAFVTEYANLVHSFMDPKRRVYVEYSNKCWDFAMGQAHYCSQQAGILYGDSSGDMFMQYYGGRAAEVAEIWSGVYASNPDRLSTVFQPQTDWLGLEVAGLTSPAWASANPGKGIPADYFTDYAVHGLMDSDLSTIDAADTILNWSNTMTDAQFIQTCIEQVTDGRHIPDQGRHLEQSKLNWDHHRDVAASYGFRMVMYEGGTHIHVPHPLQDNAEVYRRYQLLMWGQEWADLVVQFATEYFARNGTLYDKHFEVLRPSPLNLLGLRKQVGIDNPVSNVVDHINAVTGVPPVEVRAADAFYGPFDYE